MKKQKSNAKVITSNHYTQAVKDLNKFLENHVVYEVNSLPTQQGIYGFVVYY